MTVSLALPSTLALQVEHAGRGEFDIGLRLALDPALLDAMRRPRLTLLWGTLAPTRTLLAGATSLVVGGTPVRLFDGGNAFDGYFVARLARRLARLIAPDPASEPLAPDPVVFPREGPHEALSRLRLSRAFTCFQLAELIENTPTSPEPLFVLDLLATFYDESVPLRDGERLLATTLTHLKRLAAVAPVIVGAHEPQTLVKERWRLLDDLQAAADAAWMLRAPQEESVQQMRLF
ncbi:MAG TPA: hypothetical protein VLD63_03635 [Anaerolineales bacterium]|nr:hypothetical protein [Anaerolineales bacterium]